MNPQLLAQRRLGASEIVAETPDALAERPHTFGVWLTTTEACDYLRYTGRHRLRSLYRFIARTGVKVARRSNRALLLKRTDLDRAIGATGHVVRHDASVARTSRANHLHSMERA